MNWIVIMAGGSGKRFWPLSRKDKPKQMLKIIGSKSLIRQAYERALLLCPKERILIVVTSGLEKKIKKEIKELPSKNILIEPEGRDTAACIGLAAVYIKKIDSDAVMATLPADHIVKNKMMFKRIIKASFGFAKKNKCFITLGIKIQFPSTGYGYIEKSGKKEELKKIQFYKVKKFYEKPDERKAKKYYAKKDKYFWNSGIFIWDVDVFLEEMERNLKPTYEGLKKIQMYMGKKQFKNILKREYSKFEKISVDYAIMEKAKNVYVIPNVDMGWDDVGSWQSLERHYKTDKKNNISIGNAILYLSENNIVYNDNNEQLITTAGVNGLIIVSTKNAILICDRKNDQIVKNLVNQIEKNKKMRKYL